MKTLFLATRISGIFLLMCTLPLLGIAQKADSTQQFQTLFGNSKSYGGYGALSLGYTTLGGHDAFISGVKGAWIIGHGIGLGFEGAGFIAEIDNFNSNENHKAYLAGGYGGLLIEPVFFPLRPIHFSVPVVFGGGAVSFENTSYYNPDYPYNSSHHMDNYYHTDYDQFYLIQPGVEIELNITRFFRLALGGNYRFTSDINLTTTDFNNTLDLSDDTTVQLLEGNDLNAFGFYMSFKFGKF